MKHFIFVFFMVFFSANIFAQTEIWQIAGNYGLGIIGESGNIYLAKGEHYGAPEKLIKVDSDGIILWEKGATYPLRNILFSGAGIFALFRTNVSGDRLTYYDTDGEILWTKDLMDKIIGNGAVDEGGNLFIIVSESSPNLLKINLSGDIIFQKPIQIPTFTKEDVESYSLNGPYIDNSGKLFVIVQVKTVIEKSSESSSSTTNLGYVYVYRFDRTTGTLLAQTTALKKDKLYFEKSNSSSTTYNLGVEWPYLMKIETTNGNLVLAGPFNYELTKETEQSSKSESISQWRILITTPTGKSKMFKYKGKGIDNCKEEETKTKSDNKYNWLNDIAAVNSDFVYLLGTTARGKGICGEPALTRDLSLLKYNTAKKKAVWAKTLALPELYGESEHPIWITNSQKIMFQSNPFTISIYDENGNPASTMLTFSDINSPIIKKLNKEDGILYLNSGSSFIKYTYSTMQFIPSTVSEYMEKPQKFNLEQNYPNPFNPTTTVEFSLPEEAIVTLKVYNTLGQEVTTLLNNELMDEGIQEYEFDASELTSGVYFYRIVAQGLTEDEEGNITTNGKTFVNVKKMLLIK